MSVLRKHVEGRIEDSCIREAHLYLRVSTLEKANAQLDALLKQSIVLGVDDKINYQLCRPNAVQKALGLRNAGAELVSVLHGGTSCNDLRSQSPAPAFHPCSDFKRCHVCCQLPLSLPLAFHTETYCHIYIITDGNYLLPIVVLAEI